MVTLRRDMFDGGVKGKFYFNDKYDPKNPVYSVINFDLLGRGSKQTTAVANCLHYPDGYTIDVALVNRIDDRIATPEEIKEVSDRMKKVNPGLLALLKLD